MAFDGIDRKSSFSLTDFHDFEDCSFRFFVFHHLGLGKKYELSEGSYNMALGSLLDETLKLFHKTKSYNQPPEYVANLIKASCSKMLEKVASNSTPSFYSAIRPFLDEDLCTKASDVFINYYKALGCKIKPQIIEPGFCEWIIDSDEGKWKLWGGPDAIEDGGDCPEVCDYKSRENIERGKEGMDMILMPKIYVLLCSKKLQSLGYKKARFVVRFWQDPLDSSFSEEFDLSEVSEFENVFKRKIRAILEGEIKFCEKNFCKACQSDKRKEYMRELEKKGVLRLNEDLLFSPI